MLMANHDLDYFAYYLQTHQLQTPDKQARLIAFREYLFLSARKDPGDREKRRPLAERLVLEKAETTSRVPIKQNKDGR